MNATLPDVDDAMVYKYRPRLIAALRTDLDRLQTIFGLEGPIEAFDGRLIASQQPVLEAYTESGMVLYWDKKKAWNRNNHNIPNETAATRIAAAFLNRYELQPSFETASRFVRYNTEKYLEPDTNRTVSKRTSVTVSYPLTLSGRFVGERKYGVAVGLGTDGEVIMYSKSVRDWEQYRKYPLIDPNEALVRFKAQGILGALENVTASIESVSIRYWPEPSHEAQTYLQPVYLFEGTVRGIDPSLRSTIELDFSECVPAVDYEAAAHHT